MNFICEDKPKLRRDVQLYDVSDMSVFTDKLNIIFLQLPCLKAENINECNLYYEFLLYLLQEMKRNMKTIDELKAEVASTQLPQATKELFYKVLDTADIATLSGPELMRYESDLKNYMDTMGCIRYAEKLGKAEGKAEGIAEGKAEVARSMKQAGMSVEMIAKYTGLDAQVIENM